MFARDGVGVGRKLSAFIEVFLVYILLLGMIRLFRALPSGNLIEYFCIVVLFVTLVSLAWSRKDFSRYGISQENIDSNIKAIVVFATSAFFLFIGSIWSACVLMLLSVTGKDFSRHGITMRGLGGDLKIVAICIIPVLAADCYSFVYYTGDPISTLTYSALTLLALFVILPLLTKVPYKENTITPRARVIVPAAVAGSIISLVAIASMMAQYHASGAPGLMLKLTDALVSGFVLQAIPQQLLFNGFIQSRLNEAFGRPYKLFGIEWGAGLVITAMLFGLMHVLNTFNPFTGHFGLIPEWGIWTFCFWLIYGFLREKTGNITAPTIVHGIEDTVSYLVYP